jgi:hypothetical protein
VEAVPFGGDDPWCVADAKAAASCAVGAGKALAKLVGSVVAFHVQQADPASGRPSIAAVP